MTANLSKEELAEFREIFNLVDKDGGGSITKDELGDLMETLRISTKPEEIEMMINDIDKDKSGTIDFDEFVQVMSKKVNTSYTSDQVRGAFRVFEGKNPPGFVKADALIRAICTYGSDRLTEEQATELVAQLEANAEGLINYHDYINIMMA